MNQKIWILLIPSMILTSFQSINKQENDLEKMELKGPVKSLIESSYSVKEGKKGEITKGERVFKTAFSNSAQYEYLLFDLGKNEDGLINKFMYNSDLAILFNEMGYKTEITKYTEINVKNSHEPRKEIFKYDSKGNLIEKYYRNYDGVITGGTTYEYDIKGNLIKTSSYGQVAELSKLFTERYSNETKNKHTFTYDGRGNIVGESFFQPDGHLKRTISRQYDEKGNLRGIIDKSIDNYGRWNGSMTTYKYEIRGNKTEENNFDGINITDNRDYFQRERFTYKYDEQGKKIETNSYKYDSESESFKQLDINCKYEYDKYNNWIRKVGYKETKPMYILEREIKYY